MKTQVTTNEEAFAEASSQLALAPPYTGDEEEEEDNEKEMEDNTEKREVSAAAGLNEVDNVDVHSKPNSQSFIHLPNLQPVISKFLILPPIMTMFVVVFPPQCLTKFSQVILNSRQDRRSQGPPLPPDVLARIQVDFYHFVFSTYILKALWNVRFSSFTFSHFVFRCSTSPTFTTCRLCLTEPGHLDPVLRGVPGRNTKKIPKMHKNSNV